MEIVPKFFLDECLDGGAILTKICEPYPHFPQFVIILV